MRAVCVLFLVSFVTKPAESTAPAGDGVITPNFFANSPMWTAADGKRIQAHSGMVFQDEATKNWCWIGNSDEGGGPGGLEHTQISLYTSPDLYGPWGAEEVLITLAQVRTLPGVGTDVTVLERPKVHQAGGAYYVFLHLDDDLYRMRRMGIFKLTKLAAPSASNPWTVLFTGHPGQNAKRGGKGFEVLDFNIYNDPVTNQLLYATTTDAYVFPAPQYCDTDVSPGQCDGDRAHCQMCANTAVVIFTLDLPKLERGDGPAALAFTPRATLPGRWEGMTMFRKPGDEKTLYFLCSGQDGFGPNPISLFSGSWSSEGPQPKEPTSGNVTGPPPSEYSWPAPLIFTCLGSPFSGSTSGFNSQPFQVLQNPYSADHAIYLGDNWLHGPGQDSTSPGSCSNPSSQPTGNTQCEPWQGDCPCNWPQSTCPGTSNPGGNAGYVWLSFPFAQLGQTNYLLCAHSSWNMKTPPAGTETCYTFNLIPDPSHTPGFTAVPDYSGKPAPLITSSCGYAFCPGWPLTPADNAPTSACCQKLGDSITQAKYQSQCWRSDLCGGVCKDTEFGNIPGGDGQCKYVPFDPSKAKLIGSTDCTKVRAGTSGKGQVVDPCRGAQNVPAAVEEVSERIISV